MQKKESFCFLLGCFNRYAVIFCSPTETETYRNRKFDPETEISASGSNFLFRLCSTPTQIRCAKCLPCAYSGRKRARRQTIKWYAVPTNLCPASSTRTLPTFPPEVAKRFSAALRPAMPPPTIITSYLLLLPSKSILKLSKSFLCRLQSNKRIARTIYKIGDFCLLSCSLSWSNSNGFKGRLQIKIRKIIIENKGSQGHGLSTVGAKINDVYFNNILDEEISFLRLLHEIELGSKN